MENMTEIDLIAETLWSACYDAAWLHYSITGRFFDFWKMKRFYLTDEISLAAEITAPSW